VQCTSLKRKQKAWLRLLRVVVGLAGGRGRWSGGREESRWSGGMVSGVGAEVGLSGCGV